MKSKKLTEIEKLQVRMDSKFYGVEEDLKLLKENDRKLDKKLDRVLNQLDSIAGQFKKFGEEQAIQSQHIFDHNDRFDKLERIVFAS